MSHLNRPVLPDEGRELLVAGLVGGQVRDAVDDFLGGALTVEAAGVAHDAEDPGGAGEVDPGGGRDLDEAFGGAGVAS